MSLVGLIKNPILPMVHVHGKAIVKWNILRVPNLIVTAKMLVCNLVLTLILIDVNVPIQDKYGLKRNICVNK